MVLVFKGVEKRVDDFEAKFHDLLFYRNNLGCFLTCINTTVSRLHINGCPSCEGVACAK